MKSVIAVLVLAASTASAQNLTLDEALREASAKNLDLKVAQSRLLQVREISNKTLANYLPQVRAGGAYIYNNVEAKIGLPTGYFIRDVGAPQGPPEGGPVPGAPTNLIMIPSGFQEATIQRHHQIAGSVEVSQAIFAPALIPALQAASLAADQAELSIAQARQELLFAVAQLYFGAVGAKEAVGVQTAMLEAQRAHEKDAQTKVNAGAMPKIVLLRAQIDRARAEQDVVRVKAGYESAKSALSTLLDRKPDFDVVRPAAPPEPPAINDLDGTAVKRSDVEAAEVAIKVAEAGRRSIYMSYLPNLGASAKYQIANVAGFTGQNDSWSITLGLNWTLWDGGLREASRREATAKVEEAMATRKSAENRARDEIRRAQLDLETARANKSKAEEQLKLARENQQLVKVGFDAGTSTYIEVSDANTALLGAELQHLSEDLQAQLAVLRLAKAAGAFEVR